MGSNPSTVMQRAMACAHWRAHGAGVPSPCGPGRRRRSSRGWRRRAWGPSGWAHRCGCGGRRNKAACVRGLAAELPGVPHRYGAHPFLREVATPVLAADSRAQVQRRPTVRGWRASAREGLAAQRPPAPPRRPEAAGEPPRTPDAHAAEGRREVGGMIGQPCAASCTTLQGGPGLLLGAVWPQPGEQGAPHCSGLSRWHKGANARAPRGWSGRHRPGACQQSPRAKRPCVSRWRISRPSRRRSSRRGARGPSVRSRGRPCRGSAQHATLRSATLWAA
jgi:hypothetical protein